MKDQLGSLEPKNYHILGVDVLLDKDCEPHLLEINANPSINILFDNRERFEKAKTRKVRIFISKIDKFRQAKI